MCFLSMNGLYLLECYSKSEEKLNKRKAMKYVEIVTKKQKDE